MSAHKRHLFYLGFTFLFLVFLSSIDINIAPIEEISNEGEKDPDIITPDPPIASDGQAFYRSNNFDLISENFGSTWPTDWTASGEDLPDVTNDGGNWRALMQGTNNPGTETSYVTWNGGLPDFIHGSISFYYEISGSGTRELYCEVYDTIGGLGWHDVWSRTTSGSGTANFDISDRDTTYSSFNIRFRFYADGQNDDAMIDTIRLSTYEFCWTEEHDDIEPSDSQDINMFLCPEFPNYMSDLDNNNVSVWYNPNDSDVTSGTRVWSSQTSNNFTITIPSSGFDSSETVYYQIWINDDPVTEYHYGDTKSFTVIDRQAPSISNINNNATDYDKDVKVDCNVVDNANGVGVKNVTMYIKNGSIADKSDILILCEENGDPFPLDGTINFIIPSIYLSAREDLHYRIYFIDDNDNEDWTGDLSFSVGDNINPVVSFDGDNATASQIESDMDLAVNFSITEPASAEGLKTAELLVKVHASPPTADDDYNYTISPEQTITLDGGIFTFIIPTVYYDYGKSIYCWVNATDISGNTTLDYNDRETYTVVDTHAPSVVFDPSNAVPASYNDTNKFLIFDITEPSGGPGINNATLKYKLNNTDLDTGATIIEYLNINQYVNQSTFDISGLSWKYGQKVYYNLTVYDKAHNKYTVFKNFSVSDYVKPNLIENANNTNGMVYGVGRNKLINVTVVDPDYDILNISSGIKYVELYWKAGSAPTLGDYDGLILSPIQTIDSKNQSTYTLNLTTTVDMFNDGPEIFYRFNITDWAGTYNFSVVNSFMLYSSAITPGSLQVPEEYISSSSFTISFNLNFYSEIWYKINDTDYYGERVPFANTFTKIFNLNENPIGVPHNITFFFQENQTSYTYSLYVDLTAPSKVTGIDFNLFGSVLELLWDKPGGTDVETIYRIYRSTDKNNIVTADNLLVELTAGNLLTELPVGTESYSDTSLEEGNTYYYIIVAVDRVGNISEVSEVVTVNIPSNPIMMILLFVIIGAVAGIAVFAIKKSATKRRREMLFSKVDLKAMDIDDDFELEVKKDATWDTIQTKAPEAAVISEGFEFTPEAVPISIGEYWPQEIGKMISEAANFELNGEHAKALNLYTILLRLARRADIPLLTTTLEAKLKGYYKTL